MRSAGGWLDSILTPARLRVGAWAVVALAIAAAVLNVALGHLPTTAIGTVVLPDWFAHWTAGRLLLEGRAQDLYDPAAQQAVQDAVTGGRDQLSWFVSPPAAAVLYVPLALLSYLPSAAVWAAVTVGLLASSAALLRPLLPGYSDRQWSLALLVVASSQPVLELVGGGQDSAVVLLVWVVGLRLLAAGRDGWGGAVLALGLVKPQLVVLVPLVLLIQRRWSALAGWCAGAAGMLAASLAVAGPGGVGSWLSVLGSARYHDLVQVPQAWMMHGLPSVLVALAPEPARPVAEVVGLGLAAALVVALLVEVRRRPRWDVSGTWALVMLTTLAASPHLLSYDLVLAVPAVLHLLQGGGTRLARLSVLAVYVLTWTAWARHALGQAVTWLTWTGASWAVVPLLLLWWEARRRPPGPAREPRPPRQSGQSGQSGQGRPAAGISGGG